MPVAGIMSIILTSALERKTTNADDRVAMRPLAKGFFTMTTSSKNESESHDDRRLPICLLAPEWAEHARFDNDQDACDDGRAAITCGRRSGEKPCTIA